MKLIIKYFPEITIKSRSVRLQFVKILAQNIRNVLNKANRNLIVLCHWDNIEISVKNEKEGEIVSRELTDVSGIHHILIIEEYPYIDFDDVFEKTFLYWNKFLNNKSFCVRVKRRGKHDFTSQDVERYVGGKLNKYVENSRINLSKPDVLVKLEIKNNRLLLVVNRYEGSGGYPIGSQEEVFSLISGGFDSAVSSYQLMRRGCLVHYCFFRIGGSIHEIYVSKLVRYLWDRFGCFRHVNFVVINFESVIAEILEKINVGQRSVILKRMMLRVASMIASRYGIRTLVTGEALGQVSSQTLSNLAIIDSVTDFLVLRPLISYDKEEIIRIARKIGVDRFCNNILEYCAIVSKKPTAKAVKEKIEFEESKFDFSILKDLIEKIIEIDIKNISNSVLQIKHAEDIEIVTSLEDENAILDIRSVDEQRENPLLIQGKEVKNVPFYKLSSYFAKLDRNKTWVLYCHHGVMSRLQALYLREKGFKNLKIYLP